MEGDGQKWLDKTLLQLAIYDGHTTEDKIEIVSFSVEPAVESGNNYCSILYRVVVEYHIRSEASRKSFIIKAPLPDGHPIKAIIEEANFTKNEVNVYKEIFPQLYQITSQKFCPENYFCQVEDVLILEDLRETGYTMCDRLDQLDLPHCQQFMKTLAQYHAATAVLHEKYPKLVEDNGDEPLYTMKIKSGRLREFNLDKFLAVGNIIRKHKGLDNVASTIDEIGDSILDLLIKVFSFRGKLNVLNHGDCWTNNILFKHDEDGNVVDCKLVDFQIRRYGSPAIDLVFFLLTSPINEVREHFSDELLNVYRDNFNRSLSIFGSVQSLSAGELAEEMREMCPWALMIVANYLPMILNDIDLSKFISCQKSEESQHDNEDQTSAYVRPLLGKTFNRVLPDVCRYLETLGVTEYFENLFRQQKS